MSANLDLVRSIYADIERGDYRSAEWAHPQIEYVVADGPEPGSFTGREGMAQAMRSIFSALTAVRTDAEEYRELDAVRVLVLARGSGRGKRSGVHAEHRTAEVFEIHDGKVTRIVNYFDRAHALADLGLTPDADSSENLDLVRSIFQAWERGDFSSAEWADPEIEYSTVGGPEPGSSTADTQLLRSFLSVWDDYRTEAEEYRQLDSERILVLARSSGRGKISGLEIAQPRANLFHIRRGKVTRAVFYWDREQALVDLGLAPQVDS
jgi:ketosteroid isomerase-like protein